MPTILGVNFGREFFGGGAEILEKNKAKTFADKICHRNSLGNSPANFPKIRRTKMKHSPQIRSAEPRAQHFV